MLFITFWLLVSKYSLTGSINTRQIISFYLISSGMTPFFYQGFGIGSMTIKLIKSGELNQILIKPINPILYPWAIRTGRNAVNLTVGLTEVIIGIVVMGGLSTKVLPYLPFVLLNTLLINEAFNIFIGTIGFYTIEALGIKSSAEMLASFFRGSYVPLFLMPTALASFLQYTPFPASQYHLARLLQGQTPPFHFMLLGTVWAVVLITLAVQGWHRGLEKYEAVGI